MTELSAKTDIPNKNETSPLTGKRAMLSTRGIYEELKSLLIRFEIKPGERLNEIEISKRLNVSRTPLREVLNQLMVEGFLEREANKGFVCRQLTASQIFDLYEFRVGLETSIVHLACERATAEEIIQLKQSVKHDAAIPENSDPRYLLGLDEAFHIRLAEMTKNEEYVRALSNVNARIQFVRWIDMREGHRPYTQAEHTEIAAAIQERNGERAAMLLKQHISRRKDQITEVVKLSYAEMYTREKSVS